MLGEVVTAPTTVLDEVIGESPDVSETDVADVPDLPVEPPPVAVLSAPDVQPGESVSLTGPGIGTLEGAYDVVIGDQLVPREHLDWFDDEVVIHVTAQPGDAVVAFRPVDAGPDLVIGLLVVLSYHLPAEGTQIVPGQVLIQLEEGVAPSDVILDGDASRPVAPGSTSPLARWHVVTVPAGEEVDRILAYSSKAGVTFAEFNAYTEPALRPNDRCYDEPAACEGFEQWSARKSRLTAAWEVRTDSAPIAILDTGVQPAHEDLAGLITHNRDFTGTSTGPCDGHGTSVALIAAANSGNGVGLAGAGWDTALVNGRRIGSYKAMTWRGGPTCQGTLDELAAAIDGAFADGFRVINMSMGSTSDHAIVREATDNAWNGGAVLVAAAMNAGVNQRHYPAANANVIAVAASDEADGRALFTPPQSSNWGSAWVDIAAPGVNVPASSWAHGDAHLTNSYNGFGGTSAAAPLVSGVVALLMRDGVAYNQIEGRLLSSADAIDWGTTPIAGGRLNAYKALRPGQGCIRDIPHGAFVRHSGTIYQVTGATTLRGIPKTAVLNSWKAAADIADLCAERFAEMTVANIWGYRPGTIVQSSTGGPVYLITTDGTDRGLPEKRAFTSSGVLTCLGWSFADVVVEQQGTVLAAHPAGRVLDSCQAGLPRTFPNGTVVTAPSGERYVIDLGVKRKIPSDAIFDSWFDGDLAVTATSLEITLLGDGPSWGFRQGRLIRGASGATYIVTDNGVLRAAGSKRGFTSSASLTERDFGGVAVQANRPQSELDLHPSGAGLENPNVMD